jgi:hypothetical protein
MFELSPDLIARLLGFTPAPEEPIPDGNDTTALRAMFEVDFNERLAANQQFREPKANRQPRRTQALEVPRMTANADDEPLSSPTAQDYGFRG